MILTVLDQFFLQNRVAQVSTFQPHRKVILCKIVNAKGWHQLLPPRRCLTYSRWRALATGPESATFCHQSRVASESS
jgi:hypothetical protein